MSHRFESSYPARDYGYRRGSWGSPRSRADDDREGIRDRDQSRNHHHSPRESPASYPSKISFSLPQNPQNPANPAPRSAHHNPRSPSSSSLPPKPSPTANGNPTQDVAKALLDYGELVAQRANLNLQRDSLDRAIKQRTIEYDKSMQRHPEFQSVPEMQNKFRDRQTREAERLADMRRSHEHEYIHAAEQIARELLNGLPLVDARTRSKEADDQLSGGVKFELESLKRQVQQLKESTNSQLAYQENTYVSELDRLRENHASQLSKQQLAFNKQIEQLREDLLARQATQEKRQVEQELRQVEQEKRQVEQEKRQVEQERRQLEELRAQASKHDEQIQVLVQEQKAKQEQSDEAKTFLEGLAALRSESASLKSEFSSMLGRVDDLTQQWAQYQDEVRSLRASLDQCLETANDARLMLGNVDFGGIEHISEALMSDLPSLQRKVTQIEKGLDAVSRNQQSSQVPTTAVSDGTLERTVEHTSQRVDQVTKFQEEMGALWGGMLDDLREETTSLTSRTKELEQVVANQPRPSPGVESIKDATDKLGQDFAKLTEKVESASVKMERECEYLNHKFNTLDAQFNNISTKGLAERIIAQMEQFYPNNAQIVADIDELNKIVRDFNNRWSELSREQLAIRHAFDQITGHIDHLHPGGQPPSGNKRKRVDPRLNGEEANRQTNGTSRPAD